MDEIQPPSAQKVLIIRLSSIGDIVLTTPVVRAIKSQMENVELHFLTKKVNEQIVNSNPHIDKVHLYDVETPHKRVVVPGGLYPYRGLPATMNREGAA